MRQNMFVYIATLVAILLFIASPVLAGNINWMGNPISLSAEQFGGGFKEAVVDGVGGGVVAPIFEDVKPEFGYVLGPVHGAIRSAVSIPGSTGKHIFHGVGNMIEGAVGWIPIVSVVGHGVNSVFGFIGDGFGGFGEAVGGQTSKMHPSSK